MKQFKIVVEKHPDTYVACPLGLKGMVICQGLFLGSGFLDHHRAARFKNSAELPDQRQPYPGDAGQAEQESQIEAPKRPAADARAYPFPISSL